VVWQVVSKIHSIGEVYTEYITLSGTLQLKLFGVLGYVGGI
jgi:hypothetical protein